MARKDAIFVEGEYYHLLNRGCNRQIIFNEVENYRYLLQLLRESMLPCAISIVAYCLMPNHFHLLVRQNSQLPVSVPMQRAFHRYAMAFNRRYHRSGTLFEERFRARQILSVENLSYVCRYIHRNPVEAGLVGTPADWPFSDYLEWVGKRERMFAGNQPASPFFSTPDDYEAFVLGVEPADRRKILSRYYLD